MTAGVTIILPIRGFESGKSRLAPILSMRERRALNARMFAHVFGLACEVVGSDACLVVSPSQDICDLAESAGAQGLIEGGSGLNAALEEARRAVRARGSDRILALSCDLPLLAPADIEALLGAVQEVVVAPDVEGSGTNALLTRGSAQITYRFGPSSFRAHVREAESLGAGVAVVNRPGLATDLDLPGQLSLLDNLGSGWRPAV